MRIASQGERWRLIEHFKGHFAGASGSSHAWSSSESWAESDLQESMLAAASNPPLFLEAMWLGCEAAQDEYGLDVPDVENINKICREYGVQFLVRPPRIEPADSAGVAIPVPAAPPTLSDNAVQAWQECRQRAEQLLADGRPREAVQEMLWILESLSTAFRGLPTPTGEVRSKYFNRIVKELQAAHPGSTLDRVAEWSQALHGYLSSPTGGGVRHGLDLNEGVPINAAEGRLMCNLVTSYIVFLLAEHERLSS